MSKKAQTYELILLGATGYTGKLTAEHITRHCPTDLRWAIAGRNGKKLESIANELERLNPDRLQPAIETLEITDAELDDLAKRTVLILTTVGPYMKYGTPVVEACAKNGTHYIDVTGEIPWVHDMIDKYHDTAKATSAIMIPQSGLDSVPADILTWVLAKHIRQNLNVGLSEVLCTVKNVSRPSGGSMLTALSLGDHYTAAQISNAFQPYALSPVPHSSVTPSSSRGLLERLLGIRYDTKLGILTHWMMSSMDTAIVQRSWGLFSDGSFYGPNFSFSEWQSVDNVLTGVLINLGARIGGALMSLSPARWLLKKLVVQPGDGPSIESTLKDYAHYTAIGIADCTARDRAIATLRIDGSMYAFTGLAAAEAAMVILRGGETEAKKLGGGILTPATLGGEFVERLIKVNVPIDVKMLLD